MKESPPFAEPNTPVNFNIAIASGGGSVTFNYAGSAPEGGAWLLVIGEDGGAESRSIGARQANGSVNGHDLPLRKMRACLTRLSLRLAIMCILNRGRRSGRRSSPNQGSTHRGAKRAP